MSIDFQKYRLDGVYRMNDHDQLMLRVKLPAGQLDTAQALAIAQLAGRYAGGRLHATCRGSLELHRLTLDQLEPIKQTLQEAGLTSRGACGGAVRGVSCSTGLHPDAELGQKLARSIQQHFTGNPDFEGLPKKFKVGIDLSYDSGRHLIQDAGLICVGTSDSGPRWDVWVGGGLGRAPKPGLLLVRALPEDQILPLLEQVISLYVKEAPKGKRLKHVVQEMGAENFRQAIRQAIPGAFSESWVAVRSLVRSDETDTVIVPLFAGELSADLLKRVAHLAERHGDGRLLVTADQDLALFPLSAADRQMMVDSLTDVIVASAQGEACFRICCGSHDCRLGLAPTRDIASQIVKAVGGQLGRYRWAISGCPNSCSQPQLADIGIVTKKKKRLDNGKTEWRFDIVRRQGQGLGQTVASDISATRLTQEIQQALGL